jgi:hypothetical protein
LISDINAFPDIFTSSRGVNEINIVLSNSVNALALHFVNEKLIQKLENLASITVKLPKKTL